MAKKKLDSYKYAIEKLGISNGKYWNMYNDMSDMKNWLCVHATSYTPRRNEHGELYISTTGMATGYKYARATVHFTLNQIVSSHLGGNWDGQPVVILVPYNDVVEKNGNPRMVATEDTFFIPNPDTGLILPESAHVVKPNNDTLFQIGDKISTYKTDHFTDEEIEIILSFVSPYERKEYEKYANADFTEYEIQEFLHWNEKVRKGYENAADKRGFLRGLFEEDRMIILTMFLREAVVRMAMKKMGYDYVRSHEDHISQVVADAAVAKGINATSGNKGHSGTIEREFEQTGLQILDFIHMLETNNVKEIYEHCVIFKTPRCILSDDNLDAYQLYVDDFLDKVNVIRSKVKMYKDLAEEYPDNLYYQEEAAKSQEDLDLADKWEKGGIAGYNQNLDVVLHRNASRLNQEYAKAMEKLKQNPEYPLLMRMIKDLIKNGRKWHKTKGGWQPEPEDDFLTMYKMFGREI